MNTSQSAVILTVINFAILIIVLLQSRAMANQTFPEVRRVRPFELVDGNGRVRSQLNVGPSGEVAFRLRDEKETMRVKLGASENCSGLVLIKGLTEPGVHMLADQNGTTLTLTEQGGAKRVIQP